MAWAAVREAVEGYLESAKVLFSDRLTVLSIPSKWTHPLAPITTIECTCCFKSYEMKEHMRSSKQATVTCTFCGEAMEVFVDRYGNMKATWRQKSYL